MKIFVRAQGFPEAPALERRARSGLQLCIGAERGIRTIYVAIFREQRDGYPDAWACRIVARCEDVVVVSRSTSATATTAVDVCCGRVAYALTRPKGTCVVQTRPYGLRRAS
jgi:hypothetical protein